MGAFFPPPDHKRANPDPTKIRFNFCIRFEVITRRKFLSSTNKLSIKTVTAVKPKIHLTLEILVCFTNNGVIDLDDQGKLSENMSLAK